MKKKASHSDRMRPTKKNIKNKVLTMNSESNSNIKTIKTIKEIDNPFNKVIDRHFGSFKCSILGNYKKVFNSLNINSIKPLGNKGSVQRKLLRTKKFTAIFYCSKNKGSVELKIPRNSLFHKQAIEALRTSYFEAANKAKFHLEKYYNLPLSIPIENRLAKYGVEDSAARAVNLEIHGKNRLIDASTRLIAGKLVRNVSHVDNFGSIAAKADARLSDKEHDLISNEIVKSKGFKNKKSFEFRKAKGIARLQAPEILESIETKLEAVFETNSKFAKNINLHLKVEQAQLENMVLSNKLLKGLQTTKKRFPTSFKKSASVKGCS